MVAVRAVAMVLRAQARQYWKSWLALAVLVALAGGLVVAALTTARRTAAAFPDFVSRRHYDAVVYSSHPVPSLARIPQIAQVTPTAGPVNIAPRCYSCRKPIPSGSFGVFEIPPRSLPLITRLLAGRMPDQSRPGEVLASYTLARDNGVHVGTVIQILTPTPAQVRMVQQGKAKRSALIGDVPRHSLRVVGLAVTQNEFEAGNGSRYDLFTTRAFAAAVNRRAVVLPVFYVRLRHGAADLPAFDSELRPLHTLGADDLDADTAAVQRAISPQAADWWILAGLTALAGLAVIGQAAARQFVTDQDDRSALAAVGLRGRQFVAVGLARAAIIGALGAAGAAGLAAALSPLTPVGEARLVTGSAGQVVIDPLITVTGALATVAIVVMLSAWPAVRQARLRHGDPPVRAVPVAPIRAVASIGAPPSALIGVRYALDRGPGRRPAAAPGRDGAARDGAGGHRARRDGHIRRQPDPAHLHPRAVRCALPGGLHQSGHRTGNGDYPTRFRSYVAPAQEPAELVNFGESVNFPLLFGVALSLFGAATMVHLLLVSVRRRRTEVGLLKVLGFVRHQVGAVVSWQATAVALVGIGAGLPLGIAAGRLTWRVFASEVGAVPVTVVPVTALAALAGGVLVAANLLAVIPAWLAARSRPAQLLRAE